MLRTALLAVVPALVISASWLRLEEPREGARVVWILGLALAPAFLPGLRLRLAAAAGATVAAAAVAFEVSPLRARPFDGESFLPTLVTRVWKGFLDYYDVALPFAGREYPLMHGTLLLAVFVFALAVGLAVASRRALLACAVLVAGAGWPATLLESPDALSRGALILAVGLGLLAGLRPRGSRGGAQALVAGVAVVIVAVALSSSASIAKGAILDWRDWDFYTRPGPPVNVEYVWRSDYTGIDFPDKPTTVLKVKAPDDAAYWRALTLDAYTANGWVESLQPLEPERAAELDILTADPELPSAATDSRRWMRADVSVEALRDIYLPGGSVPVAYDRGNLEVVQYWVGGTAVASPPIRRGDEYSVWSYAPDPRPAQLARSRAEYPPEIELGPYLSVELGFQVPPFGAPGRHEVVAGLLRDNPLLTPYAPLYRRARTLVARSRNPYAATVALEGWFRGSPSFRYVEHPPLPQGATPALVDFVVRTRQGYCQHYAGAMALMLRYLGIPARVAAGFTAGRYDEDRREWIVSDTNAHTWVEVWFEGYGWLPFDPTPGRGRLTGLYTASSLSFDRSGAQRVLQASALGLASLFGGAGTGLGGEEGGPPTGDQAGGGSSATGDRGTSVVAFVVLAALGLVALVALAKLARRRSRYLTRDPRRLAGACRRELHEYLVDQGLAVPPSATLTELGEAVRSELGVDPARFVHAADAARFGPPGAARVAGSQARRELGRIRRALRARLSAGRRLRGLVSLRSFAA